MLSLCDSYLSTVLYLQIFQPEVDHCEAAALRKQPFFRYKGKGGEPKQLPASNILLGQ